jgi:hypothetical protein
MSNLDYVNIEEKTVNVAVFNQTDAALAELKIRYTIVPDCSTKEGYAEAKAGKSVLTKYRTSLETARKEIKGPYKVAGEIIDTEAKRIKFALEAIENPIKDALKIADEAEAKKKADRITRLQAKVDEIYLIEANAHSTEGTDAIAEIIESLTKLDVDNDYYDLTTQAQDAKAIVLDRLGSLLSQRLGAQIAETQRVEAEERSRIAEAENEQLRDDMRKMKEAALSVQPIHQVKNEKPIITSPEDADLITSPELTTAKYKEMNFYGNIHLWGEALQIESGDMSDLYDIINGYIKEL